MAKTPSSRKAKGRRLQQDVCNRILEVFSPELETDDVRPAIMGESGVDVKLSPLARRKFPYSVECKNVEALNIWGALKQADENKKEGTDPLVVFKRNRSTTYVALEFETFLKLLKGLDEKNL